MDQSTVSETLFICRSVSVFKIPPRPGGGHKSGTWLVEDKIFTGRLRVVSQAEICTVLLEDDSGQEFAQCPIPPGEKEQAVEAVTDSSRYFVLRLMTSNDARQKAFVGLGFDDRSDAFDFQVALTDHEKHLRRAKDAALAAQASSRGSADPPKTISAEAANLYQSRDLSLKEGETIKINFRKAGEGQQTGALKLASSTGPQVQTATLKIPPPITQGAHPVGGTKPAQTVVQPQMQSTDGSSEYISDLLGIQDQPAAQSSTAKHSEQDTPANWATF